MKIEELSEAIDRLKELGLDWLKIVVEIVDKTSLPNIEIVCYQKHEGYSALETHRLILDAMNISSRIIEKESPWAGETRYKSQQDNLKITGPYNTCKITGYKDEIVPAKPEQVIPAEPETIKKVPIYDCSDMPEIENDKNQ